MNDHLAGSTAAVELVKRTLGSSEGEFAEFLSRLSSEIEADREVLLDVMRRVGARRDPVKQLAAVVAERIGRLKLNGRILETSPLSRLVELEALALGVEGKRALWMLLGELEDPRLADFDFAALARRAQRQRRQIEGWRRDAGRRALAG